MPSREDLKVYNVKSVGIVDCEISDSCTVVMPSNLYGCQVSEGCFIGPFVEVQRNVRIGAFTRIQSHSFICEFVSLGEKCFIGHGVMFINDLFRDGSPANGDISKWRRTNVGNNVSIGSNSTILPVDICDDVVIGAGAVVTKNINEPGIYAGNPAKLLRKVND